MRKEFISIEDDTPQNAIQEAYVVCTTPRSGSNLLILTLEEQGLGYPHEYVNNKRNDLYYYLQQHTQQTWENDPSYLDDPQRLSQLQNILQQNRCSENGIFGTKLFAADLYFKPERFELFQQNMKVPTKYIVLKRRNIVEKAISLHFAFETEQWYAKNESVLHTEEVKYHFHLINKHFQDLRKADLFWHNIFPVESANVMFVYYQDLTTRFEDTIQKINHFLGHGGLSIPKPPTQKQIHPLKKSFEKLFIAEYKHYRKTQEQNS